MLRRFIFKNNTTGQEIVLPVTPSGFQIDRGVPVQTLDMHGFGEYNLPGAGLKLFSETLDFILPRQRYPFCLPEARLDPYYYIEFFQLTSDRKQTCRFVVSDTPTVCDVLIENLQYGERDGTNDVYCTLSIRRWRPLFGESSGTAQAAARTSSEPPATQQSYIVQRGDTLASICRKFYGDAGLAADLATFNSISNPVLPMVGKLLRLPARDYL